MQKIDFAPIFGEILVFENRLPVVVYFVESKLPELYNKRIWNSGVVYYGELSRILSTKNSPRHYHTELWLPLLFDLQLKCAADGRESILCESFTRGSRHKEQLF